MGDLGQAAEKAGLSTLVDMRLLELAATRLASRPEVRIVLGVSPSTLRDGEWLHGLAAHLGARPGIQTRLIVAVHEATLCETGARGRLDAMKALGVGIMLAGVAVMLVWRRRDSRFWQERPGVAPEDADPLADRAG